MYFKHNIDRVGRRLRILAGILLLATGIAGLWWAIPGPGIGWRIFHGALVAAGMFAVIEGAVGWCALRALGVKTRH